MQISQFFLNGDIKGAIAYMRSHEEFKDILPAYVEIFEDQKYRTFDIPDRLNDILRLYQIYFRDVFYCGLPEAAAADKLLAGLSARLNVPDADEMVLAERLRSLFEAEGYHALFGKTQGYYGPYIWRDTVPTVYRVELPDRAAEYTVNILKGFVFRSWMDYLTFGRYGTGGWASPGGTINCIEQAYDFESERFLVSLLKHEAQHTVDMKRFPEITPAELEYRAKLVELHYSGDLNLLQKFLSEADESKADDAHAVASARLKRAFADTNQRSLPCIQTQALKLLYAHTKEMKEKYGGILMLETGIKGEQSVVVDNTITARVMGSGSLDVYATPAMIALIEKAAMLSVAPELEAGQGTVGTDLKVQHLASTPVGMKVTAKTELIEVDRRRLVFSAEVYDEAGLVGKGTHERFIVDEAKFQAKTDAKKK